MSKVVIIAAPANAHPDLLRAVAPFVDDGAAVGALFAQVRGREGGRAGEREEGSKNTKTRLQEVQN